MVQTWRIHIRPKAGRANSDYSFGICLGCVLGCGWAVDVAADAVREVRQGTCFMDQP